MIKATLLSLILVSGLNLAHGEIPYNLERAKSEAEKSIAENFNSLTDFAENGPRIIDNLELNRFYRVGDRWRVLVRHINHGATRKIDGGDTKKDSYGDPQYFEFKVLSLEKNLSEARIEVSPVTSRGEPRSDRVKKVIITVNRELKLVSKEYDYPDLGQPVIAEYEGDRNSPVGFDTYPVDLPNFASIKKMNPISSFEAEKTIRFEAQDLLARPVKVTWQRGDLWPTHTESRSGLSALVWQDKVKTDPVTSNGFAATVSSNSPAKIYGYWDEKNFAKLMKKYAKAAAKPTPWSGFWWPFKDYGIANRSYDYNGYSPADKLDAIFGYQNWVSGWEYASHGKTASTTDWYGHCTGWATAAIMEREPRDEKTFGNITFDVADRKAILTEYWLESGSDYIGTRVWDPEDTSSDAFWDVIPAQFHLLITNVVGRQKRSLILDRYTGAEVWNQPLVAYQMRPIQKEDYLGPDPKHPKLYRVNVTTALFWSEDGVKPNSITPRFEWEEGEYFAKRTLKYELWLDAPVVFNDKGEMESSGDIVVTESGYGGTWKNGTSYEAIIDSHPDFMWLPLSYTSSTGYKNPRINDSWIDNNLKD